MSWNTSKRLLQTLNQYIGVEVCWPNVCELFTTGDLLLLALIAWLLAVLGGKWTHEFVRIRDSGRFLALVVAVVNHQQQHIMSAVKSLSI